jgi:hypothetical protein
MKKIQEDVAAQADAALADLDFAALGDAQFAAIEPIAMMSPRASEAMKTLRAQQAAQPTLAGFNAAVQAAGFSMRSPEELAKAAAVLLAHPSLAEGMKTEHGSMALEILSQCPPEALKPHADAIAKIGDSFTVDAPTALLVSAESYIGLASAALPKAKADALRTKS